MKLSKKTVFMVLVTVVACLIIGGTTIAAKPNNGSDNNETNKLTQEQIEKYQDQGYELSDIYTAQSISGKTQISVSTLLSEKARGLSWPEVINKKAPDQVLKREDDIGKRPPGIDKKKVKDLQAKGHSLNDISEAFTMAWRYDKSVENVLEYKKGNKKWQDIDSDFALERSNKEQKEKDTKKHEISFLKEKGKGKKDESPEGLSADTVNQYLSEGYDVKDVLRADAIARKHNRSLEEVLNMKADSKNWGEVVSNIVKVKPKSFGITSGPNLEEFEYPATDEHNNNRILNGSISRLTLEQFNQLIEIYSAEDVFVADSLASKYGFNVETALELKQEGKDWGEIISQTSSADISMSLDDLVTRYNLDAAFVNSLLNNNGLKLSDIRTAGELSLGTNKPFEEIIRLRLVYSDWQEVFNKLGIKVQGLPSAQSGR